MADCASQLARRPLPDQLCVTTPSVGIRITNKPGDDRIEVNIGKQLLEVGVVTNNADLVVTLPQTTQQPMPAIVPTSHPALNASEFGIPTP